MLDIFKELDLVFSDSYFSDDSLRVALPGFAPNEVSVEVSGRKLIVKTNPDNELKLKSVEKVWLLPNWADTSTISSVMRNGLLVIKLGKSQPTSRKIEVIG